jgi:hypothetical protein
MGFKLVCGHSLTLAKFVVMSTRDIAHDHISIGTYRQQTAVGYVEQTSALSNLYATCL